jgi:hypothetical protein
MRTAAFVILIGMLACGPADNTISSETVNMEDTPVDVPVVILDARALAAAPSLTLEEMFRIDGERNAVARLTAVPEVAFSGDGLVVALESELPAILVFDTTGSLVRQIGRKGRGPGEFVYPRHMAVGTDTLFVLDQTSLNRFTMHGSFIDRVHIQNATKIGSVESFPAAAMIASTPAGPVGFFWTPGSYQRPPGLTVERDTSIIQRIDVRTGKVSEPIAYVDRGNQYLTDLIQASPWLMPDPQPAVSSDGTFYVPTLSGSSIDVLNTFGSLARRITFAPERRAIPDEDIRGFLQTADSVWEEMQRKLEGQPAPPDHRRSSRQTRRDLAANLAVLQGLPRAELYPVVGRVIASQAGELLVERADLSEGSSYWYKQNGTTVWDVLRADGSIAGRAAFPQGVLPKAMSGRMIVAVATDQNDVPSIIAYRVEFTP